MHVHDVHAYYSFLVHHTETLNATNTATGELSSKVTNTPRLTGLFGLLPLDLRRTARAPTELLIQEISFSDEQLETSGNRSLQSPWYSLSLVHLARLISKPWWTIFGNLPRRHQTGFHLQHLGTSKSRLCPKSDSDSLRVHGFMLAPHRPWQTFAQDWFDTKTGKQKTLGLCEPIASAFPMCNRRYAHL